MPAYHQMGHDSENLLMDDGLQEFVGAILSPVNYRPERVQSQINLRSERGGFRFVFDPQLYFPTSVIGQLPKWSYYPSDVDTADLSAASWWDKVVDDVVGVVTPMMPDALCSPAVVPRTFENEYFEQAVSACERMVEKLEGSGISPIQTAVVGLAELTRAGRALEIASVLSRSPTDEIYLVFVGTTEPRRELRDVEELKGAMRLIAALEASGIKVVVGFASSDLLLWKFAGAHSCASGKFFNLRRFTRTRFEEPTGGGGQLPYWFEESLLAFLRESDLARVRKADLVSDISNANPFALRILLQLDTNPGMAWLAQSWRQYLWWFANVEGRVDSGVANVPAILKEAENLWQQIEDTILMEEPANNGSWLRSWRRACTEFLIE